MKKSEKTENPKDAPQPYLQEDFGKEFSYQLWVTKGARFNASRRLEIKQRWSTYTVSTLALYAITANLMTAYEIKGATESQGAMAFASSVMSILILITSLLEGSRKYDLRASRFHDCSLEISSLYRKLRQLRVGPGELLTPETLRSLVERYEQILARHENHEDIDYYLLQTKKSEWFQHGTTKRAWFRSRWYLQVLFAYHFAIVAPPLVFFVWTQAQ